MFILFPLQVNTLGHEGSRILPLFARVLVELEVVTHYWCCLFILAMNGHLLSIDLMHVTLLSTGNGGRRPYVISLGLALESFYWQAWWELSPVVPTLPSPFLCSWCWKISLWNTTDGYLDILDAVLLFRIKCEGYLVAGEVRREHCCQPWDFKSIFNTAHVRLLLADFKTTYFWGQWKLCSC